MHPKHPSDRRAMVAKEAQRTRIAGLYLEGRTQAEIAAVVGLSQQQISRDLKAVRKEWQKARIRDFDAAQEEQLQRVDKVERNAWDEWHRSKQDAESETQRETAGGVETTRTTKGQCGDPRYLDVVLKCVDRRCKILGLEAPLKVDNRNVHLTADIDTDKLMRDEETREAVFTLERVLGQGGRVC